MKLGTTYSAFVLISALALTGCGADDDTAPTSSSSTSASASSAQAKAGEYQPATENGPAQNVPRPQKPEGMDVESVEGLEKFLNYWFEMRDYAIKTGDTTELFKRVETSYETDLGFYNAAAEIYENNGWILQHDEPKLNLYTDTVETDGDELYSINAHFYTPNATVYDSTGTKVENLSGGETNNIEYSIIARYENDKWSLVNVEVAK